MTLRFLVLSPTPTWPLDHGNRKRVYQVCSGLTSRGHEVHFLYYPSEHEWVDSLPREALAEMERQWTSVRLLPATRPLHAPPENEHHQLDEWWDCAIGDMLTWLFKVEQYDALIVNYVWLSKAFDYCPSGVVRILDTHDRFGGRKEMLGSQGLEPEFFYLEHEDERRGLDRAQLVLAIKEQEAALFAAGRQVSGQVLTLPYAETHAGPGIRPCASCKVVFGLLGARNNLNRKAAMAVVKAVMALGRPPAMRLLIGGGLSDDFSPDAAAGLHVLGRVKDIDTFYQACDVVVVPLDASTGQKIRVGEALARGVPLIAHAHAFEGYPPVDPLHRLDSIDAVAQAMIEVTAEPARLAALGEASRDSQRQLLARVDQGFTSLIEGVQAHRSSTVLAVRTRVLEHSMQARLRLTAALRTAARWGRTELWLDAPPSTTEASRLSPWLDKLTGEASVGPLAFGYESLAKCIQRCNATLLWHAGDLSSPGFEGVSLADPYLSEAGLRGDDERDASLNLRVRGSALQVPIYAPLLLGQGRLVDWSEASGSLIWLVTPRWCGLVEQAAERLAKLPGCQLRIWCEDQVIAEPYCCFAGSFAIDGMRQQRPKQVLLFQSRGLSDGLISELVAQSGAPCLSIDPSHMGRMTRSAHQIADSQELNEWLDLVARHLELGLRLPAVGQAIPVETFPAEMIFQNHWR